MKNLILIVITILLVGCGCQQESVPKQKLWFEGENLSNSSALVWQEAQASNKLATCGQIIYFFWDKKGLKAKLQNTITTVDEIKPYAEQCVQMLDEAFKKETDKVQNEKLFSNQKVGDTFVLLSTLTGWL